MDDYDEKYMKIAVKEALKAYNKGEIPVGAVIVENSAIIAKAHNLRDTSGIVTNHAEILAILKANRKKKDWRLNGCTMYVTLEPCMMCYGAILQSRIDKVFYATTSKFNSNRDYNQERSFQITESQLKADTTMLIKNFFEELRK